MSVARFHPLLGTETRNKTKKKNIQGWESGREIFKRSARFGLFKRTIPLSRNKARWVRSSECGFEGIIISHARFVCRKTETEENKGVRAGFQSSSIAAHYLIVHIY